MMNDKEFLASLDIAGNTDMQYINVPEEHFARLVTAEVLATITRDLCYRLESYEFAKVAAIIYGKKEEPEDA